MEQLSVEEGNKLIAEFMGFDYAKNIQWEESERKARRKIERPGTIEDLQYHSSWDWLMPVVEKIEGLGYRFKQCRRRVVIEYDHQPSVEKSFTVLMVKADTKILAAWQACEKFIQWYQTQNTQP